MAPPQNQRRREALADAAIAILGTSGIHALSHRAVDERAELPAGTAANYFPTRDELLAAAARRVLGLHVAAMEAADSQVAGAVGPDGLAELIGGALYDAAARHRTRYLAIYELTLEATRRPALAEALSGMVAATLDVTIGQHRALGLEHLPGAGAGADHAVQRGAADAGRRAAGGRHAERHRRPGPLPGRGRPGNGARSALER